MDLEHRQFHQIRSTSLNGCVDCGSLVSLAHHVAAIVEIAEVSPASPQSVNVAFLFCLLNYKENENEHSKIADKIFLSFHTIHTHIKKIYEKLHVNSKGEAVAKALKNRLV